MRIESLRIENFRAFKDEMIYLDNYSSFVGPNGVGKSTVFHALNLFFRENKDTQTNLMSLSLDDFHHGDISNDIKITITFVDLSDEAKADFKSYVRDNSLMVTATAKYNANTEKAEIYQYGTRLGIADFKKFFAVEKEGGKVAELKEIFEGLKKQYSDIKPASSKAKMIEALREYEDVHINLCSLIPSNDQFYGISRGVNKLEKYIQWVFIPALKDATEETEESSRSALGQLLSRTVRSQVSFGEKVRTLRNNARAEYQKLLEAEQTTLEDISTSLEKSLSNWAHPNISASVQWKQDPDKSIKIEEPLAGLKIGERGFEGDLARFGHGLQRSYMLALLQELSKINSENMPTLIMGIEEPELFQHPPQAKYLAETLFDLAEADTQVILCTHNPLFIPGDNFDRVRLVSEEGTPSQTKVKSISYDKLRTTLGDVGEKLISEKGMIAKLYPILNPAISEMFFCKKLILVEGHEDLAYITSYLSLSNKMTDFRREGCHIVPVGGKSNLVKPLAMAKLLGISTMVIYDSDTDKDEISDKNRRNTEVSKHKKDNKVILSLKGYSEENIWPTDHIVKDDLTAWKTNLTIEVFKEIGAEAASYQEQAMRYYGHAGGLKKNPLAIAKFLELAWVGGVKSKLLLDLMNRIGAFLDK